MRRWKKEKRFRLPVSTPLILPREEQEARNIRIQLRDIEAEQATLFDLEGK